VKHLWRTVLIVIASALVVGATWLLTPTNGNAGSNQQRPAGQQRGEGGPGGRERGNGGINLFGFGEVLAHIVLTGVVTAVIIGIDRALNTRGESLPTLDES
jgi:hypothetical protein